LDNEVYGNYAGGAIDNLGTGQVGKPGDLLTIQRFDYTKVSEDWPVKTVVYNNDTGQLGHYGVGRFREDSPVIPLLLYQFVVGQQTL